MSVGKSELASERGLCLWGVPHRLLSETRTKQRQTLFRAGVRVSHTDTLGSWFAQCLKMKASEVRRTHDGVYDGVSRMSYLHTRNLTGGGAE